MKQLKAPLRVCASCEWIFKTVNQDKTCPKCNFVSYGARFVYGDKCYSHAVNQKPWRDRKLQDYNFKLGKEINETNPLKIKRSSNVKRLANLRRLSN